MSVSLIPAEYFSQVLEQSASSPPTTLWSDSYTMQLFSLGGAQSLDTERIAIVGADRYNNYVAGNREVTTRSQDSVCGKERTIRIQRFISPEKDGSGASGESDEDAGAENAEIPPPPVSAPPRDPHAGVKWGHDKLEVSGDAELRFHTRTILAKGKLDRTWNGGVVRLASFEGVICGGFFTRVIAGPSVAASGIMTSDVYGGAIKLSKCRLFLAGLHYRAAKFARWKLLIYMCAAPFNIRPAFAVAAEPRKGGIKGKIQRLASAANNALRVARWLIAPISIAYGALKLLVGVPVGIAKFLWNYRREKPPPVLQRRVCLTVGVESRASNTVLVA